MLNFIAMVMAWYIAGALLSQIANIVGDTIQVGGQSRITEEYLFSYALFPIIGLLTGIVQYALLRRYLPHMAWWIAATFLGWLTPFATSSLFITFLERGNDIFSVMFAMLLIGVTVAVPQWWMLRKRARYASWWILAYGLVWCITGLLNLVPSEPFPVLQVLFLLAIPLMLAIATGLACWLLLDRLPKYDEKSSLSGHGG